MLPGLAVLLNFGNFLAVQIRDVLNDDLALLLERLSDRLLVREHLDKVLRDGLVQLLLGAQLDPGGLGVLLEVEGLPVRAADALDPAVRGEELGVPAVAGVMGHLVVHVLAEAEALGVDADPDEEELDARHEVAKGLVGHGALEPRMCSLTFWSCAHIYV